MVSRATYDYDWDRRQAENRGKVYHHTIAGFFHGPEHTTRTAAAPDDGKFDSEEQWTLSVSRRAPTRTSLGVWRRLKWQPPLGASQSTG